MHTFMYIFIYLHLQWENTITHQTKPSQPMETNDDIEGEKYIELINKMKQWFFKKPI